MSGGGGVGWVVHSTEGSALYRTCTLPVTMAEDRVYIGDFTRKEFRERMEAGVIKACIVPVSSECAPLGWAGGGGWRAGGVGCGGSAPLWPGPRNAV